MQARYLGRRERCVVAAAMDRANVYGAGQEKAGDPVNYSDLYQHQTGYKKSRPLGGFLF
jgi:hypothetical protein